MTWYLLMFCALSVSCDESSRSKEPVASERLVPELVFRTGAELEFNQVGTMALDRRGNLYVADSPGRVVVLDRDGSPVRIIGREGAGPGEFQSAPYVQIVSDDTLLTYDAMLGRMSVYPFGAPSPSATFPIRSTGTEFALMVRREPSGEMIGRFSEALGAGDRLERSAEVVRAITATGEVASNPVLKLSGNEILVLQDGPVTGFHHPPFAGRILVQFAQDRIYTASTDSNSVHIYDRSGRRIRTVVPQLDRGRRAISPSEYDSVSTLIGGEGKVRSVRSELSARWKRWPRYGAMIVDDQGFIWLRDGYDETAWFRFDGDGALLAVIALPQNVMPRLIAANRVYTVAKSELDEESVAVYALVRESNSRPVQK